VRPHPTDDRSGTPADTAGVARFGVRALLSVATLALGAAAFLLLWLLVRRSWTPLQELDDGVAEDLNALVTGSPAAVTVLRAITTLGNTSTIVVVFVVITVVCLVRGQRRLAVFTAATGVGVAVLVPLTKALVDRARPALDAPVVPLPSSASFPSGHALGSLVAVTVLALVVLPSVRRRARPWVVALAVLVVLAVGVSRLALGVHFVSDVLAGWALGAAWVTLTTAAFRGWQHRSGTTSREPLDPLEVAPDLAPGAAPDGPSEPGDGRRRSSP